MQTVDKQILAKGWTFENAHTLTNSVLQLFGKGCAEVLEMDHYWVVVGHNGEDYEDRVSLTSKEYRAVTSADKALKMSKRIFPDMFWDREGRSKVAVRNRRAKIVVPLMLSRFKSFINDLKQSAEAEFRQRNAAKPPAEMETGRPQRVPGLRFYFQNPWMYGETVAEVVWLQCKPIYDAFSAPLASYFREIFRLDAGLVTWQAEEPIQGPRRPPPVVAYFREELALNIGNCLENANAEALKCDVG